MWCPYRHCHTWQQCSVCWGDTIINVSCGVAGQRSMESRRHPTHTNVLKQKHSLIHYLQHNTHTYSDGGLGGWPGLCVSSQTISCCYTTTTYIHTYTILYLCIFHWTPLKEPSTHYASCISHTDRTHTAHTGTLTLTTTSFLSHSPPPPPPQSFRVLTASQPAPCMVFSSLQPHTSHLHTPSGEGECPKWWSVCVLKGVSSTTVTDNVLSFDSDMVLALPG